MIIARFRESRYLVRDEVFIKNITKVASRVSSNQLADINFGKLLWKANEKKFSFRRVESSKISSHPGRYLLARMLKLETLKTMSTLRKINAILLNSLLR